MILAPALLCSLDAEPVDRKTERKEKNGIRLSDSIYEQIKRNFMFNKGASGDKNLYGK